MLQNGYCISTTNVFPAAWVNKMQKKKNSKKKKKKKSKEKKEKKNVN